MAKSLTDRVAAVINYAAMSTRFVVALAGLTAAPVLAQLAAPTGNRGVAMGDLHLTVPDVDAQRKFWVAFGGTPLKNGTLELIEFPGVYNMLRPGEPAGGSVGSVVNHVGFNARNSADSVAQWQAAGLNPEPGNAAGQFSLTTADASYARIFDARPGTRGRYKSGDIGGANLTYGDANEKAAPTKGRALDHIGFEVANMDLFAQKLQAQGIEFDMAPGIAPNGTTKIAFLTDPRGTYIELTQGLAPAK
jgi:catechol 2,3-dioxygenase-like lactoylglutathione lyase family enzyme